MNDLIRRSDSYDHATLADWYIASVDGSPPVWTDEHIEELLNDFYVIPKDGIPAVDAVEVVRCDACDWHVDVGYHYCNKWCVPCPDNADFFCAYGERPNCGADMREES